MKLSRIICETRLALEQNSRTQKWI